MTLPIQLPQELHDQVGFILLPPEEEEEENNNKSRKHINRQQEEHRQHQLQHQEWKYEILSRH
jgi:hypothetical protein